MAQPRALVDHRGAPIRLAAKIGSGGEADVFSVDANADVVAKLYHSAVDPRRASKLDHMVRLTDPDLARVATWPIATLHDPSSRAHAGFLMPRVVDHKELHVLYGPTSRRKEFPAATWAFLAHVAMNCAAAFESVHSRGAVIADVNARNIVVSSQATVRLLDCDSFQIVANGVQFLSEVGVPEYTPPELQGRPFAGVVRTANHDCFGLAVVIFHLLFMGRHPFFGAFTGAGDMPQDRAIREFRFAYGADAAKKQMRPPPFSLPLHFVTPEVGNLFELAFSSQGAKSDRPSASRWLRALTALTTGLQTCGVDATHKYPATAKSCAWCEIAQKGGPSFFYSANIPLSFTCAPSDLDETFKQFQRFEDETTPPPVPAPTAVTPQPLPANVASGSGLWPLSSVALAVGASATGGVSGHAAVSGEPLISSLAIACGAFTLCIVLWRMWFTRFSPFGSERKRRAIDLADAAEAVQRGLYNRGVVERNVGAFFASLRSSAAAKRNAYAQLKPAYDGELSALERNAEGAQLRAHLESFDLWDATISGVGEVRKASLRVYGFDTALDVLTKDLLAVPGIGQVTAEALKSWARGIERRFKFDAKKGVPESQRRALAERYRTQQRFILGSLKTSLAEAQQASARAKSEHADIAGKLQQAITQEAQARANAAQIGQPSKKVVPVSLAGAFVFFVVFAAGSSPRRAQAEEAPPPRQRPPTPAVAIEAPAPLPAPTKKPSRKLPVKKAAKKAVKAAAGSDVVPVDPYADDEAAKPVENTELSGSAQAIQEEQPALPETLDDPSVSAGLVSVNGKIAECYEQSPMKGDVRVSLHISPTGAVASVNVLDAPSTSLSICMKGALKLATFAATQNGGVYVRTIYSPL